MSVGQGHGGSLVCYNQASAEDQGATTELGASSPSENGLWAGEIGEDCTCVPAGSLANFIKLNYVSVCVWL